MQKCGRHYTSLTRGALIQWYDLDWMEHTLAKNTSRRPSSFNACSQTEEIAVSSAASACKVVTLGRSAVVFKFGRVDLTFTSGYFF